MSEDLCYQNWKLHSALSEISGEARWPHGQCAHFWIERSGIEPRPGALCCVLLARH